MKANQDLDLGINASSIGVKPPAPGQKSSLPGAVQTRATAKPRSLSKPHGQAGKSGRVESHYDPESANANRASQKRRPAPLNPGAARKQTKAGGQPTQQKKSATPLGVPPGSMAANAGSSRNPKGGNPSGSETADFKPVASHNIVKQSELEALRNYNAMMNEKMRQGELDKMPLPGHQPPPLQQQSHPHTVSFSQNIQNSSGQDKEIQIQPQRLPEEVPLQQQMAPQQQQEMPQSPAQQQPFQASSLVSQPQPPMQANSTMPFGQPMSALPPGDGGISGRMQGQQQAIGNPFNSYYAGGLQNSGQQPNIIPSIINPSMTIYKNVDKDKHQIAIVGSGAIGQGAPASGLESENKILEKELKQKQFAEELKKQIEQRDFHRAKDEWRKMRATQFTQQKEAERMAASQPFQSQYNPSSFQGQMQQMPADEQNNDKTFYVQGHNTNYAQNSQNTVYQKTFDASITKADFPEMKLRARVLENRVDLELEKNGNILTQGRDEKYVIQNKREAEQQAMREALQKQIDEKQRKKDEEKEKQRQEELRDDVRVQQEMRALAIAEGMPSNQHLVDDIPTLHANANATGASYNPVTKFQGSTVYNQQSGQTDRISAAANSQAARKTAYAANQHSISIIGSDIGRAHLPSNLANASNNTGSAVQLQQNDGFHQTGAGQVLNENKTNYFIGGSPKKDGMAFGPGDKIPRSPIKTVHNPPSQMGAQLSPKQASTIDNAGATGGEESLSGLLKMGGGSPTRQPVIATQSAVVADTTDKIIVREGQDDFARERSPDQAASVGSPQRHNPSMGHPQIYQKDQQINELSEMVKELLKEQQELKQQIQKQSVPPSKQTRTIGGPSGSRRMAGLNKKASERVPRGHTVENDILTKIQPSNKVSSTGSDRGGSKQQQSTKNLRSKDDYSHIPLPPSNKPGDGNPKQNIKQTNMRNKLLEKKRRDQQDKEKDRLDAIEAKIENARKRLEEKKKQKSENAKNTLKRRTAPTAVSQQAAYKDDLNDDDIEYIMRQQNQLQSQNKAGGRSHKTAVEDDFDDEPIRKQSHSKPTNPSSRFQQQSKSPNKMSKKSLQNHNEFINDTASFPQQRGAGGGLGGFNSNWGDNQREVASYQGGGEKEMTNESHLFKFEGLSQQHQVNSQYAPENNRPAGDYDLNIVTGSYGKPNRTDNTMTNFAEGGDSRYGNGYATHFRPMQAFQQQQMSNPHRSQYQAQQFGRGNDSFDMEFIMPPDITSIDSDINKIGALTPSPFLDNVNYMIPGHGGGGMDRQGVDMQSSNFQKWN